MQRFVFFQDFAYDEYLPVVQAVADAGYIPILTHGSLRDQLQAAGRPVLAFESFFPEGIQQKVMERVNALGPALVAAARHPAGPSAFLTADGNLLSTLGGDFFHRVIRVAANQMMVIEAMKQMVARGGLSLVVMRANISGGQRVLATYAQQQGIPVLELSHGHRAQRLDGNDIDLTLRTHYAAYGQREKDTLVDCGNDPDQIHVTGSLSWDAFYGPERTCTAAEARRRLGLDPNRPMVLYCPLYAEGTTAFYPYLTRQIHARHDALAEAMAALGPDVQLVVRPHPGEFRREPAVPPTAEALQAYHDHLAARGVTLARLDQNQRSLTADKATLIRAADAVVVANPGSTMTSEVMIFGRPVVLLDFEPEPIYTFYTPDDGVTLADGPEALTQTLQALLADPAVAAAAVARQDAALGGLNHGNDGRAAERVAQLIVHLAAQDGERLPCPAHQHTVGTGQRLRKAPQAA